MTDNGRRSIAISVVSPVHNEEEGLKVFVQRVVRVLERLGDPFELVLVDDGSTDASWDVIVAAHAVDPRVRGIQLSRNFGKESAMLAGLEAARGHAMIVMDSDLQHPPELIPDMVRLWRGGAEVVEGLKRNRTGQSVGMRLSSRGFNRVFWRLTRVDLTNASDFRLLSARAVDALLSLPERTPFFRAASTWIGFRREQLPFDVDARTSGASRWRVRSLVRFALDSITSFTAAPLHLVTIGAFIFGLFAVVLGVQTLVRYLLGDAVTGFTTVILLLLILGTLTLAGLGIIGHYLARIYDEVKHRPRFLVSRVAGEPGESEAPSE